MAEITKTALRGILIPDTLMTAYDSSAVVGTAATQAGPKAGRPVKTTTAATDLALEASGTQTADTTLKLQTARGGYAEPEGAGFVWRLDDAEEWRGWDVPNVCTGWEHVVWSTSTEYRYPHCITTDTDRILVVYSIVSGGNTEVRIRYRDASAGTWGTSGIFVDGVSSNVIHSEATVQHLYPALVRLPSGRIQCFYLVFDGSANLCQVSMHYSDDHGSNWKRGSRYVLDAPISTSTYTPKRLRVAASSGQHCLTIWSSKTADEVLAQYASDDRGSTFSEVATWDGSAGERGGNHDLVYAGGAFLLAYSDPDTQVGPTDGRGTKFARVASAFTSFLDASPAVPEKTTGGNLSQIYPSANVGSGTRVFDDSDQCLAVTDVGEVCWYWRDKTNGFGLFARSLNHGQTWIDAGVNTHVNTPWYYSSAGANDRPRYFTATEHRGRVVILHNWEADTAGADYSIGAFYLGGYSTVTMPSDDLLARSWKQTFFILNWLPFDLPGDSGFTKTTAGTPTETLTNGKVTISGNFTTDQIYYTFDENAADSWPVENGLIVRWRVKINSGQCDLKVHNDDGTEDYAIEIRAAGTTLTLRDQNAVSELAQDTGLAGHYDVLVAMQNDDAAVWYREVGSYISEDREWILLHAATGLTDSGGTLGAPRIRFGKQRTSPACNADIFEVHSVYGTNVGTGLGADLSRPEDLFPRAYSAERSAYVAAGVKVRATDGPTVAGDTFTISTEYNYPADAVIPSHTPSPRIGWRSTNTPGDMEIPFTRSASLFPSMGGYGLAIYIDRINFPEFKIAGKESGGWAELADVDCSATVGFVRAGSTVKPRTTAAGADGYYLAEDQLAGGYFYFPTSGDVRRIEGNSAGYWAANAVNEQRAILRLEECDGGEDAAGDAGKIWFPRALVIIARASENVEFSAVRIEIDDGNTAPDPPEGYYQIGTLAIGHLALLARDYDWGFTAEREALTEVEEQEDGTIRTRSRGPSRRRYQFGYGQGIDVSTARGSGNDPSYARLSDDSGAPPVASADAEPLLLDGLLDALGGADTPIVFCPRVPVASGASGDAVTVLLWDRAAGALYGRLTSSTVRLESVVGDDFESELFRVANLEITEIT